jgi:hypothetical protein
VSVYIEVELRCDGVEGDPFGCTAQVFAGTGTRARADARSAGWKVNAPGGKDYCPDHRGDAR